MVRIYTRTDRPIRRGPLIRLREIYAARRRFVNALGDVYIVPMYLAE